MKKLLIISYDFPPALAGVRRILKWIQYLPQFGWRCAVLTVKDVRTPQRDQTPLSWLKEKGVPIFRCCSLDPYRLAQKIHPQKQPVVKNTSVASVKSKSFLNMLRRWIFIPDDRCGWIPFAAAKGIGVIRKIKPDAILTTSFPNSAHIVGVLLKRLTGILWVADFRDAWTQNPLLFKSPTPVHRIANHILEKSVAKNCDLLLGVSDPITDYFKSLVPNQKAKIHTLTNGYDETDFTGLTPHPPSKFTLVYTGTLFGKRTPLVFLEAVKRLLSEHPDWRADFEILFYCTLEGAVLRRIKELGLADITRVEGFRPYKESLQHQLDAAVLLLFIAPEVNAEVMLTQKVFEYLWARRPILAMVPEGACRKLLRSFDEPHIVHPSDVAGIEAHLKKLYKDWKSGRTTIGKRDGISAYERLALTERLASLLDELMIARKH